MELGELLVKGWPFGLAVAPGLWAVWKQVAVNKTASGQQRVDLIKIAQEAAAGVIESLEKRIEDLEAELTALRKEHSDVIHSKDAELALLRGELRNWMTIADTYERQLTDAGIPHEKPAQPFWRVPAGDQPVDIAPP